MKGVMEKTSGRANENNYYRRKYYVKQLVCEVVARWV